MLSAARLNRLFLAGELSAVEIAESALSRIAQVEPAVGAFITVAADHVIERAKKLDARRKAGDTELGPLAGVPIAVKDNICTSGMETTCASRILKGYVSPFDATVVERLRAAGAMIIGKANMDEFAMGSSGESSAFGVTRNPWDLERVPGGSSSGSAAAVAAGEAPLALGTDTGGSIRQPAAFTGIVGLKPTYGYVSRYGVVAFASSLDQVGPMGRDVEDVARLFEVIAGPDRRDATNAGRTPPALKFGGEPSLSGVRLGVPKELLGPGIDPGVKARVEEAIAQLEELGATVEECSLPSTEYALSAYYVIAVAEASSNLARFDGVRYGYRAAQAGGLHEMYSKTRGEGFGTEVKRRIMLGTYVLSAGHYDAYYRRAQQVRTLVVRDFERAFERYDALVTPTTPFTAWKIGEKVDDPVSMYLGDICTIPVNLAGLPAVSVPCGFVDGLPVGMQLIGKPFADTQILQIAWAYQKVTKHHEARPALTEEGGR
ncbi:Asp-tRNA(Asn)/Glu-tRNA(Gln) amidotransferase subunit GatA [Symbiobacterium thermophilum]|uniref:Glutamyl-tRNA(Gln) amidotransferase subunit A n=3 Tax=Symbiobacterium thermophilum TaxID=2734 RepID=GATA_SYMTH|nr:Asp-tRNA(Asn)/Glu-tRNA(Gln) amidotransferase subunit GatA [Symbiobacterium thermophilum]Q67KJ2.1 RecName: Full=Glutamyl-tRNA(Gln) amidotransferase subunit A; Short=Glu-ADT subunit A [Symbiobacterium thermophilum IAM 14863]MBY6276051.1 Asp-tRNA(Asn)/Glu-tRNA(Gln) amidotransferase GatCAB subunit A [Symbiobacterium thermophilum]BAD41806.1 glutamyl-tRNA(Gln) amidotransferase subunit A [Symbiobacterium thermophilum IAM 14863]